MLEADRIAMLDKRDKKAFKNQPGLVGLKNRLLAFGGERVIFYPPEHPEPHLDQLLERGRLMNGKRVKGLRGFEPSHCHENSALLWKQDPKNRRIVTGYGLSDWMWCQHSWVTEGKTILETTVKRSKYFGFTLTFEESLIFYAANHMWLAQEALKKAS